MQNSIAQVSNSVLASGDWYQFSVDTTGVFKIDRSLLQQIGVSTNNLNPSKIHIYGKGGQLLPVLNSDFRYDDLQENAIYVEGENDGSFDGDDFKHNLIVDYYEKIGDTWQRFGNDFSQTSPFFIITGFNARVEHLIPEGTNKTQQGEISYMISPYFNPVTENDSARFTFYLLDRDLNQSNLETTTAFKKP